MASLASRAPRAALLAGALCLAALVPVADSRAGLMTQTFTGRIDSAFRGNLLALSPGDEFQLTLVFDPAASVDGSVGRELVVGPGDPFGITLQIGGQVFTEVDDVSFGNGIVPVIFFDDSASRVTGVDFIADLSNVLTANELSLRGDAGMALLILDEDIDFENDVGLQGFTVFGSVQFVPEATSAVLLGLGLALLSLCRQLISRSPTAGTRRSFRKKTGPARRACG